MAAVSRQISGHGPRAAAVHARRPRLGFFGWIMVAAYLAFLTPREAGKLLLGAREIVASVGQRLGPREDLADRAAA